MLRAVAACAALGLALSGCGLIPGLGGDPGSGGRGAASRVGPLPKGDPATVAEFGEQDPIWRDCLDGVECADVRAPLDWADPSGETITLRLVKRAATGAEPQGTLFVNPGGPGASGADYVANGPSITSEVQEAYDVVGWDPRGVGMSSHVTCLDAAGMDDYLFGPGSVDGLEPGSDEWIDAALADSQKFGEACERATGPLLGHVSTADTVQDLDMLRAVFGEERLDYLGFSYGTYIGARYADAYPERVGRLVLDGAMDPSAGLEEVVREQTRGFETALRAYVEDCLTRKDCPLSGGVDGAMAQIGEQLDAVDAEPLTGSDGRMFSSGTMLTAIITPLYSQSMWGYLDDLFASVADGNADVGLVLADFYFDRQDGEYLSNSTEAFSAINCLDYPLSGDGLDPVRMAAEAEELDRIAPTIGRFQGYGDIGCAGWPVQGAAERAAVSAAGADPILVVGTTGDPATPYRWAESLAGQLESATLLTYVGEGHTAYGEDACIDEAVDAYLLRGEVPEAGKRCG